MLVFRCEHYFSVCLRCIPRVGDKKDVCGFCFIDIEISGLNVLSAVNTVDPFIPQSVACAVPVKICVLEVPVSGHVDTVN